GMLGILKAGGAYVPLDPAYPAERLAFMLKDSAPVALLTQQALVSSLSDIVGDASLFVLDEPARTGGVRSSDLTPNSDAAPAEHGVGRGDRPPPAARSLAPHHLAYVIYTSGSTGRPKGVMIEHRALANFLASMAREPGLERDDVLLAVTTLSFDI